MNNYGLQLKGIETASQITKNNEKYGRKMDILYIYDDDEVWTDVKFSEYDPCMTSREHLVVATTYKYMTVQEIADKVHEALEAKKAEDAKPRKKLYDRFHHQVICEVKSTNLKDAVWEAGYVVAPDEDEDENSEYYTDVCIDGDWYNYHWLEIRD